MKIVNLLLATVSLAMLPCAASATVVNVVFSGTFASGEVVTGKISYNAVDNPTTDEFFEFHNQITSFSITSARFVPAFGRATVTKDSGGDNRIRYFSGNIGATATSPGFNTIQFLASYDASNFASIMSVGINFIPAQTFDTARLPTAFSFNGSQGYNLSTYVRSPSGEDMFTNLDSIVATPAAVPEPATWGLMTLGFGLTGAAMRRRRVMALAA